MIQLICNRKALFLSNEILNKGLFLDNAILKTISNIPLVLISIIFFCANYF